jgi:hypothetical protein
MADEIRNVMGHIKSASVCSPIHSSFLPCHYDSRYKPDPKVGLQLAHAGRIYAGRSAKTLVKALLILKRSAEKRGLIPKFTSYGGIDDESRKILENKSGVDMLLEKPFIPYDDCMKALSAADVLVLFVAPQHQCQIPGKLFDYISCNRPVLAFIGSENSSVERVIKETGVGWVLNTGDTEGTVKILSKLSEKKANAKSIGIQRTHMLKRYHRNEELRQLRATLISACKKV